VTRTVPGEWITYEEAAQIIGCARSQVQRLVARGWITTRASRPVLDRASVEGAERRWRADQQARRALAETNKRAPRRRVLSPDDEHTWLGLGEAADLLGLSQAGLSARSRRDGVPYTEHDGRRWYRADLLQLINNAVHNPPDPDLRKAQRAPS
jgi:hypothetical protein